MKRVMLFITIAGVCLGAHRTSFAEALTREALDRFATHYEYFLVFETEADKPLRYLYADEGRHLHLFAVKDNRSELQWETTTLGSPVTSLTVADTDADGRDEIVVSTLEGRIVVWDVETYDRLGENYLEPFGTITSMVIANLDEDPQLEIIINADRLIHIYDGKSRGLEWRSQDEFHASEMLVANVDDDPQLEIILNTGRVIDSRFYYIEPTKVGSGGFGNHIRLLDINGDGFPEVFGETAGFALRVYDLYAQRVIW